MLSERKDRKSTRLNSSHTVISYAVFCLKKKIISNILFPPPSLSLSFFVLLLFRPPPIFTLFPYTTLFRSRPEIFHFFCFVKNYLHPEFLLTINYFLFTTQRFLSDIFSILHTRKCYRKEKIGRAHV